MRHASSRGLMLRAYIAGTAALISVFSFVTAPAAAALPAPPDTVAVPDSAWTPGKVNRTVVGGAPPARRAWQPGDTRRVSCASSKWGILPDYPMERFKISDRLQFGVNLYSGDLWVDHRDLTVRGTGLDMTLRHSYGYQQGWHPNSGSDMALDLSFSTNVFMPMDGGACASFPINADGSYGPAENGVRARLTKNAGNSYTVRFIDSGETRTYNPDGWLLNRADRNGNTITYYYNTDGTLASIADSQGRVTTFTSTDGEVTRITDPSGTVAGRYVYDDQGNLTQLTDRDGKTISFGYDDTGDVGDIVSITDHLGRVWRFEYSDWDEISKVVVPRQAGAAEATFTYDTDTQTTYTDPNGNRSVHTFDGEGRQISAKDALGHTQAQTWTTNGDLQSVTDGLNNSTTATFDTLENLTTTKLPTGATATIGYTNTALPNLPTSIKDPEGNELTRDYDSAGNLTEVRSTQLNATIESRYYTGPQNLLSAVYDGNDKRTGFEYDAAGNLTKVVPPAPMGATQYTYDSLSRVTSITDGAGKRVDYAYDRLDRVVAISSGGTTLQSMVYDALGNLTTRTTPGVVTRFRYDAHATGSLVTSAERTQGASVETVTYTYDKAGNLKTLTEPAGTTTYTYDAAYRLTSLLDPFGQTTTFEYDNADRRTKVTWPGAGTQTNGYDNAGRRTSITVTDPGGVERLKATYNYSSGRADRDQLQSKTINGGTVTYDYDALRHLTRAGGARRTRSTTPPTSRARAPRS